MAALYPVLEGWRRRDLGMFTVGLVVGTCTAYLAFSGTGERTAEEQLGGRLLAEHAHRVGPHTLSPARPTTTILSTRHHHTHRGDILRHTHTHPKQAAAVQVSIARGWSAVPEGSDQHCTEFRSVLKGFQARHYKSRIRVEPPTSLAELWDLFDTMLFAEGWQAPQRLPKGWTRDASKRPGAFNGIFLGDMIQKYPQVALSGDLLAPPAQPTSVRTCSLPGPCACRICGSIRRYSGASSLISSSSSGRSTARRRRTTR